MQEQSENNRGSNRGRRDRRQPRRRDGFEIASSNPDGSQRRNSINRNQRQRSQSRGPALASQPSPQGPSELLSIIQQLRQSMVFQQVQTGQQILIKVNTAGTSVFVQDLTISSEGEARVSNTKPASAELLQAATTCPSTEESKVAVPARVQSVPNVSSNSIGQEWGRVTMGQTWIPISYLGSHIPTYAMNAYVCILNLASAFPDLNIIKLQDRYPGSDGSAIQQSTMSKQHWQELVKDLSDRCGAVTVTVSDQESTLLEILKCHQLTSLLDRDDNICRFLQQVLKGHITRAVAPQALHQAAKQLSISNFTEIVVGAMQDSVNVESIKTWAVSVYSVLQQNSFNLTDGELVSWNGIAALIQDSQKPESVKATKTVLPLLTLKPIGWDTLITLHKVEGQEEIQLPNLGNCGSLPFYEQRTITDFVQLMITHKGGSASV